MRLQQNSLHLKCGIFGIHIIKMRKRFKKGLVYSVSTGFVEPLQKPYVKLFGKLTPIKESEIPMYENFKIIWK